ncbi:hypothetical protein TNCV_3888521 [Trichonephila clavipes]|nr:hypothetical protein TNCV_3888521 [Trichonephila clavipes]
MPLIYSVHYKGVQLTPRIADTVFNDVGLDRCGQQNKRKRSNKIILKYQNFHKRIVSEKIADRTIPRAAAAMVSMLRVHAAANDVKLLIQTLAVLQMISILDSGLMT